MKSLVTALILTIIFASPVYYFVSISIKANNIVNDKIENMKKQDSTISNIIEHNGTFYITYKQN